MAEKVVIAEGLLGRWIIQLAHSPLLAWSGSRWVMHKGGIGVSVAVSNFSTIAEATKYAKEFGFEIVGIEQELT